MNKPSLYYCSQLKFQLYRIPSVDKHHRISRMIFKDETPKKVIQSQNPNLFIFLNVNEEYVTKACVSLTVCKQLLVIVSQVC